MYNYSTFKSDLQDLYATSTTSATITSTTGTGTTSTSTTSVTTKFRAFAAVTHFITLEQNWLQSGASSLAKHGGAYFSAVCGSIQDPIAAPGPYENQEF